MLKPKIFMIVGLPGSGKSTIAQEIAKENNANIHSSDDIRKEFLGDINRQDNNNLVFETLHKRIKDDLKNNANTIYDATNISSKTRRAFLQSIKGFDCEKIAVFIATPYEQCLEQNKQREREVPEHVIKRMYTIFEVPAYFEGWDKIEIINNNKTKTYSTDELFSRINNFNQDNPHHKLSLGFHCQECANQVIKKMTVSGKPVDHAIMLSALLHDIGKEFTKTFTNKKGEITDVAHFYNHENVSSYEAMLYLLESNKEDMSDDVKNMLIDICQLIRFHMRPYNMGTLKSRQKLISLTGKDFYDRLMILHKADKDSH